jgi:hypothetical protein
MLVCSLERDELDLPTCDRLAIDDLSRSEALCKRLLWATAAAAVNKSRKKLHPPTIDFDRVHRIDKRQITRGEPGHIGVLALVQTLCD